MRGRLCSWWTVWLLTCLVSGCDRNAKPQHRKSADPSDSVAAWEPTGRPPHLMVSLMTQKSSRVEVSIANHDRGNVDLATPIQLQRWHNGQWHPEHMLELRRDCASKVEACMRLAPGAEVFPPGFAEDACGCKTCAGLAPGTYRAVVQTCDGKQRLSSTSHPLLSQ